MNVAAGKRRRENQDVKQQNRQFETGAACERATREREYLLDEDTASCGKREREREKKTRMNVWFY